MLSPRFTGPKPWPSGESRGYIHPSIEQLWQIQLDLGPGKWYPGLFFFLSPCWKQHCRVWYEHTWRLLWDMNHTIHCPHVTEGITPSQVWTMASKLQLNSGLRFTTWSSVLSSGRGLTGHMWHFQGAGGLHVDPQSFNITHSNSDVTCDMKSSWVLAEPKSIF